MEEENSFLSFILKHGTLMLAIYGVVQLWLISLWKNFIRIGKVSIFKTGRLEISYSNYGPTLAVNGTLRAQRKDVFVKDISITVTKERDGSTHLLEWTAFRSPQLRLSQTDPIALELPSGFIVRADQPYRYHIFFSDRKTSSELEPLLLEVHGAWQKYLSAKQNEIAESLKTKGIGYDITVEHLYNNDFSRNSTEWQKAWDLLNRKNYWESGSYRMRMIVKTASPNKTFSEEWRFTISEQSFESLRLNAVATLREICLRKVDYFFAYPEYN
ncbi:MAG: hypothetical protein EPO64_05840 [Nitrospirae bacterium]|nr:MAG: hypothetical protein EPO64_05840 [Nitrospirota bacterium]